ncbi:hypothetical protein, partial [Corynebacterium heidelbergense]|uniref:hypothetical protein n=1 Tax=Corynebacterium heidelbergense TaxID=2055947 RepID=UPI001EE6CBCC
ETGMGGRWAVTEEGWLAMENSDVSMASPPPGETRNAWGADVQFMPYFYRALAISLLRLDGV